MLQSTMMLSDLTVTEIFSYGRQFHARSKVVERTDSGVVEFTYGQIADRAERLASALASLGIGAGDTVATLCANHHEHLEAYLTAPSMGAVLLTLNVRLSREQLHHIVAEARPKVLIADAQVLDLVHGLVGETPLEHVVVVGDGTEANKAGWQPYESLVADAATGFRWPELPETNAASACYTTGTTGAPKGVVYSHRSMYLHALASCSGNVFAINEHDRVLVVVPMFHASAWGLPLASWFMGADMLLPARHMQGPDLAEFIANERATFAAGVPTVWREVLTAAKASGTDLRSLRLVVGGGAAVPRALIDDWRGHLGVDLVQAWGMTETSPVAAFARSPGGMPADEGRRWNSKTGRPLHGLRMRLVGDGGTPIPFDGQAVGEVQIRGPWVTGSYVNGVSEQSFDEEWLRTGDIGHIDELGYLQITDRAKDVIKSGGEWISSIQLENEILAHPDVTDVAVIAVTDVKWGERPLALVVCANAGLAVDVLRHHLAERVPRWWIPERWELIDEIPRTSVGKIDKKLLRERYSGRGARVARRAGHQDLAWQPRNHEGVDRP